MVVEGAGVDATRMLRGGGGIYLYNVWRGEEDFSIAKLAIYTGAGAVSGAVSAATFGAVSGAMSTGIFRICIVI